MRLNITETGTGPLLLFVNGVFQWREAWEPITQRLSDQFRCATFDFPNQNVTRNDDQIWPDLHDPTTYEDHVLEVLEALSCRPRDARVCGLSWGSSLVRSLHLRRGVDFASLALIGLPCPQLNDFYSLLHDEFIAVLDAAGTERFLRQSLFWFFAHGWWTSKAPIFEFMQARMHAVFEHQAALHALLRSAQADAARGVPDGRFRCPTTLLNGEQDIFTPPQYAREYGEAACASFAAFAGGHVFTAERPQIGAQAIHQALTASEAPAHEELRL
jgi:pimeloyl-ACP methyl ester carboxylesterase